MRRNTDLSQCDVRQVARTVGHDPRANALNEAKASDRG